MTNFYKSTVIAWDFKLNKKADIVDYSLHILMDCLKVAGL